MMIYSWLAASSETAAAAVPASAAAADILSSTDDDASGASSSTAAAKAAAAKADPKAANSAAVLRLTSLDLVCGPTVVVGNETAVLAAAALSVCFCLSFLLGMFHRARSVLLILHRRRRRWQWRIAHRCSQLPSSCPAPLAGTTAPPRRR
jgi:hypothetical protein